MAEPIGDHQRPELSQIQPVLAAKGRGVRPQIDIISSGRQIAPDFAEEHPSSLQRMGAVTNGSFADCWFGGVASWGRGQHHSAMPNGHLFMERAQNTQGYVSFLEMNTGIGARSFCMSCSEDKTVSREVLNPMGSSKLGRSRPKSV